MTRSRDIDVAVIGAGMAGLACAQRLHQSGYETVVIEKSRGVGGRLATRRIQAERADHGAVYLAPEDPLFQTFVDYLVDRQVLHVWTDQIHQLAQSGVWQTVEQKVCYVANEGMTAIAKFLASGLDVRQNQRVTRLKRQPGQWQIELESPSETSPSEIQPILAKAVVVATPAPQAVELLNPGDLPPHLTSTLRSITYAPCFTAIAGYPAHLTERWLQQLPQVYAIQLVEDETLAWVGLDSSKRLSQSTVLVLQSTPTFAQANLETTGLTAVARCMVQHLASRLAPWLPDPDWLQGHRWRYAFVENPLSDQAIVGLATPPLVLAGDGYAGRRAEQAFLSGLAAAEKMSQLFNKNAIAPATIWNAIAV